MMPSVFWRRIVGDGGALVKEMWAWVSSEPEAEGVAHTVAPVEIDFTA